MKPTRKYNTDRIGFRWVNVISYIIDDEEEKSFGKKKKKEENSNSRIFRLRFSGFYFTKSQSTDGPNKLYLIFSFYFGFGSTFLKTDLTKRIT